MFTCSSNWHGQKRLQDNTDLFLKYEQENPDKKCCLIVMGDNPDYVISKDNIIYTGNLPHEICLQVFYASDWMIHLAWLDHCPNVVVEALSQNCPVICSSSGGTKEIVRGSGIVVPEAEEYDYRLTDYTTPPALDLTNITLPSKIEVDHRHLDIELVADKYDKVLRGKWD
jgi:glycosyltransferase involved in cell wall biosynthesis